MAKHSAVSTNIENRSPWLVQVRTQPALDMRFSFPDLKAAQSYCDRLGTDGYKPKPSQLEMSFQLPAT